ncbi:hypothetical protein CW666_02280 [Macrococcoides caseolyticum]|nr:hypothetical protein CW666_02280 [Macrococcus caseolyticus]
MLNYSTINLKFTIDESCGDDRKALLKELENWPTYYPDDLTAKEIQEEMLAH